MSICITANAQQTIEVHVEDATSKEPLYGASIFWMNTNIGSATNMEGLANIPTPINYPANLIISYVGFQSDTIIVKAYQQHIHINIKESIVLETFEVKGQKKDSYVRSLDAMKTEMISQNELKKAACCNLSESFQTNASAQVNFEDAVTGAKQIELLGLKGIYVQNTIENTPSLRGLAASFSLDNVPAPWIKNIALAKGTPSVHTGFEGITGSININYKEPEDLDPLYLDVFANHTGRFEGNLMTGVQKKKWGTALLANGAFTKDKKDRNGDTFYDQPKINQFNLLNRWEFRNDKMEGNFLIKGLKENRTSGQLSLNENQATLYSVNINTDRIEGFSKIGFFLPGHLEKSIGVTTSGFWHNQKGKYGLNNYDGMQGSFFGNLQYQGLIKNTNHAIFAAASVMYDYYDENVNGTRMKRTDIVPGVAAEYTYKYLEKITLVAGLRTDFPNHYNAQINPRIHFRYQPKEGTQIRIAGGRGFRLPNVYAENIYMFASSRSIKVLEDPKFEAAWNTGISIIQEIPLGKIKSSLAVDYYHTNFSHQVIVDIENNLNEVHIYNLDGNKSYSNSLMVEWTIEPAKGLELKAAYRMEDVKQSMHGELLRKNMLPMHRGLFALNYKTKDKHWMLSSNINIQGMSRYPISPFSKDQQYTPIRPILAAQITRIQGNFEFFVGGENLLNIRQFNPILGYENPFGDNFDTYQAWGSPIGAVAYGGVRFHLKSKKNQHEEDHK